MILMANKVISNANADSVNNEKQPEEVTTYIESSEKQNCPSSKAANCSRCDNKGVSYYLADTNSHKAKCMRAFIVILATVCAAYVCVLSSRRYFYTWVQTVIERTDVHVSEIPFPAITICPVKGLNLLRLEREATTFLNPKQQQRRTDKELHDLHMLLNTLNELMWPNIANTMETMAPAGMHHHSNQTLNIEQFLELLATNKSVPKKITGTEEELASTDNINLSKLLFFMSFECEDIFGECTWKRTKVSCCTLFRRIQTYQGVCYSFNSILVENPDPTWPLVVSESGLYSGMRVLIKRSSIGNYYEKVASMVHDPKEIGSSDINYMDSERVVITVNPLRFMADYDVHSVKPELRHCYFTGELKLLGKSRSNCIRSCRMNYIERNCNCTYFFPVATKSTSMDSLPICRASNLKCIYNHRDTLVSSGNIIQEYIDDVEINTWDCKCYPNCNYIQYRTTVNTDHTGISERSADYIDLQVQYQHDTLFSYRSSLCFTLLDLIVSYGGIAGLFLGLSLVGIIEVLHDFIMCWKLRTQKKVSTPTTTDGVRQTIQQGTMPTH